MRLFLRVPRPTSAWPLVRRKAVAFGRYARRSRSPTDSSIINGKADHQSSWPPLFVITDHRPTALIPKWGPFHAASIHLPVAPGSSLQNVLEQPPIDEHWPKLKSSVDHVTGT